MNEAELANTMIGESAPVRELRALIMRVAPLNLPVLIQGPTGSGKELVAQALHAASGRPGRCVACNICAVAESMFEDTLFGHVRGAFTGATRDARGYLTEADRGTIFFDEIGGLALARQTKLLRVIETHEFRPVGAHTDRRSDFRVLAATNEPLDGLVADGRFRSDLAHRLSGIVIDVPPLSERVEDIPLLARHFAAALSGHKGRIELTRGAVRMLQTQQWTGHVRELRHVLERAAALSGRAVLGRDQVAVALGRKERGARVAGPGEFARRRLLEVLERCAWDTARAAAELGVHRATVYRRMRRRGIFVPSAASTGGDSAARVLEDRRSPR